MNRLVGRLSAAFRPGLTPTWGQAGPNLRRGFPTDFSKLNSKHSNTNPKSGRGFPTDFSKLNYPELERDVTTGRGFPTDFSRG